MAENQNISNTTPEAVQNVSAAELADSLCANLSLDQLELLRIFSRCSLSGASHVYFCEIAYSFAQELPRRRREDVHTIADGVGQGTPFVETLKETSHANYRLIEEALKAATQYDCLKPFLTAVLDYEPIKRPLALVHQDSLRKKLIRLTFKTLIIVHLVTAIMLFIVPELSEISEEYGVEQTAIFESFVSLTVFMVHFWFVPALLFICVAIFVLLKTSHLFARLTRKFSPWRWLDRTLLPDQRRRLVFAWLGGSHEDTGSTAAPAVKDAEAKALKTATSPATRSWIVRHALKQDVDKKLRWRNRFGDAFVLGWNLLLAIFVATAAASVVSTLISYLELLGG